MDATAARKGMVARSAKKKRPKRKPFKRRTESGLLLYHAKDLKQLRRELKRWRDQRDGFIARQVAMGLSEEEINAGPDFGRGSHSPVGPMSRS